MSPTAFVIRTPTDFRQTLGFHDFVHSSLVSIKHDFEPEFRNTLAGIFDDLPYIDPAEPGMVTAYLDGIEGPLNALHELGVAIFAVVSKGKFQLASGEEVPDWSRVYYLIVPTDSYFATGKDPSSENVHRFDPHCDRAVKALLRACVKEESVFTWIGNERITADYEGNVPWCTTCCIDQYIS